MTGAATGSIFWSVMSHASSARGPAFRWIKGAFHSSSLDEGPTWVLDVRGTLDPPPLECPPLGLKATTGGRGCEGPSTYRESENFRSQRIRTGCALSRPAR